MTEAGAVNSTVLVNQLRVSIDMRIMIHVIVIARKTLVIKKMMSVHSRKP